MINNLYEKFKELSQENLNEALKSACRKNDLNEIKYLLTSSELKNNADIHHDDSAVFRIACVYGNIGLIKYLLTDKELKENINIHVDDGIGLRLAVSYGELKVVKYLLTSPELKEHASIHSNSNNNNNPLQIACISGYLDIVKYLLSSPELKEHANVNVNSNHCFIESLAMGNIDIAQYLLTFEEVKNHPNIDKHKERIFGKAVAHLNSKEGYKRMNAIKFLIFDLNLERTQQIDNYMSDNIFTDKIEELFASRALKECLNKELPQNNTHKSKFKAKI